jgi:hypothetical protein
MSKIDVDYFEKELASLSKTLDNRSPEELARYLRRLANVAEDEKSLIEIVKKAIAFGYHYGQRNVTLECITEVFLKANSLK